MSLDVNFVNPFVQGTIETLKIQCQIEVKPGKIYLKGKGPEIEVEIAGVIGLTSKSFSGSIAICFPEPIFLAIMSNMIGENYQTITHELEDGAGELLNIIFGFAKRVLNEKGYQIEKAIPTVVRGAGLEVKHLTATPTVVLPFETQYGIFHLEVGTEGQSIT